MEKIIQKIVELETERQMLQENYDQNQTKIKQLKEKIENLINIIDRYIKAMSLRKEQIESYQEISKFSERTKNLLLTMRQTGSCNTHINKKISTKQAEIEEINHSKAIITYLLAQSVIEEKNLELENQGIEKRLSQISVQLERLSPKKIHRKKR